MRRPSVGCNVGRMRPMWPVIAKITPMRRPQCDGRASGALRRPCVSRIAADYAPTLTKTSQIIIIIIIILLLTANDNIKR